MFSIASSQVVFSYTVIRAYLEIVIQDTCVSSIINCHLSSINSMLESLVGFYLWYMYLLLDIHVPAAVIHGSDIVYIGTFSDATVTDWLIACSDCLV